MTIPIMAALEIKGPVWTSGIFSPKKERERKKNIALLWIVEFLRKNLRSVSAKSNNDRVFGDDVIDHRKIGETSRENIN